MRADVAMEACAVVMNRLQMPHCWVSQPVLAGPAGSRDAPGSAKAATELQVTQARAPLGLPANKDRRAPIGLARTGIRIPVKPSLTLNGVLGISVCKARTAKGDPLQTLSGLSVELRVNRHAQAWTRASFQGYETPYRTRLWAGLRVVIVPSHRTAHLDSDPSRPGLAR
jgi:hypothetical protein